MRAATCGLILVLFCGVVVGANSAELKPGAPIDYAPLAFQPKTWAEKGHSTMMVPWEGKKIVFLTTSADLDVSLMGRWVQRLDDGWALYEELTGAKPRPLKEINGRATIAAVPDFDYTCGAGCGYLGHSGIELAMFYRWNYPGLRQNPEAMPHYVFYEMGRNFYTFGDRHSCFTTGFAVFMRYVCMDVLKCDDADLATRRTIEEAESKAGRNEMPFLRTFTNADGLGEKEPRLKDGAGRWVDPSDQPVMYASAMMKLYRENGRNEWLRRFFRALAQSAETSPDSREGAQRQCWNWYLAASIAARQDLSAVFADRWMMPLSSQTRTALASIPWKQADLTTAGIDKDIKPVWR